MVFYVVKHTQKFEFRFRGFVAAISPRMVENVVENFLVRRLDVSDFGLTFAVAKAREGAKVMRLF